MLLYENFNILCRTYLGQISFSNARKFCQLSENIGKLRNQLWFISICVRRLVFPKTIANMHIPGVSNGQNLFNIRLYSLKVLKSEIRRKLYSTIEQKRRMVNFLSLFDTFNGLNRSANKIYTRTFRLNSERLKTKFMHLSNTNNANTLNNMIKRNVNIFIESIYLITEVKILFQFYINTNIHIFSHMAIYGSQSQVSVSIKLFQLIKFL
mgnify:CR=1 FL=1